jgi:integrase
MKDAGFRPEPLGKDMALAIHKAEELNRQWDELRKPTDDARRAPGTMPWLIDRFERSTWYTGLTARGREKPNLGIKVIQGSPLGKSRIAAIDRQTVRLFYDRLAEAKSPDHAKKVIAVLRRLLNYAIELNARRDNPAANMQLKSNKPRRQRWTWDQIDAFCAAALDLNRPGWALAVLIAYDTSQRLADVLATRWNQISEGGLSFEGEDETGKTGAEVWAPLSPETLMLLEMVERRAVTLVYGLQGKPITQRGYFNRVFNEIKAKAGIPQGIQFRDLRRTAASEILRGGGRAEAITGHEPGSPILRIYEVPDRDAARAASNARRKENKRGS